MAADDEPDFVDLAELLGDVGAELDAAPSYKYSHIYIYIYNSYIYIYIYTIIYI